MLKATITSTHQELQQILRLQQENLLANIDDKEMRSQGFVTLRHDFDTLQKMHDIAPHVIIMDGEKLVAYALTMLRECRQLVPDLGPMFSLLDRLSWHDAPLTGYLFYVMGQVCIAKDYRGQGLFEQLYQHHKKVYQPQFEIIITEISIRNQRSLRAHEKIGFTTIHTHRDKLDEWKVMGWDWK